jgi:hypothetical protein
MIRLLVAFGLVCGLSYAFYPQECRLVAGRLGDEAKAAAAGVRGAVRNALPQEEAPLPPPSAAPRHPTGPARP